MSVERRFSTSESQQRLRAGPLRPAIDGFAAWLAIEGYACRSAAAKLRFVENLSRWLEREDLGVEALDEQRVEALFSSLAGRTAGGVARQRPAGNCCATCAVAASSLPPFPVRAATVRSSGSNERTNASSSTSVASVRRR